MRGADDPAVMGRLTRGDCPRPPQVSQVLIQVFTGIARDLGLSAEAIEAMGGATPQSGLDAVPAQDFYAFTRQLADATSNPDIGLLAGRANLLGLGPTLRYLSVLCTHFRQWLNMLPSSREIFGDLGETHVVRDGGSLWTRWYPSAPIDVSDRYAIDMMLATSQGMLASVCHAPILVSAAAFTYPAPADTRLHRALFGNELRFEQPFSGLQYSAESLNLPLLRATDGEANTLASGLLAIVERGASDAFVGQLRRCIVRALPSGAFGIDTVANELGISRRTLQRRLAERQLVFSEVVREVRSAMAVGLLVDKQIPVTEVAFMLGYATTSSFSTAFKAWHGCAPSAYGELAPNDKSATPDRKH